MSFQAELKRIRQRCFLSQQAFAKEINVAFSTVNRWESGKTKPNLTAMKSIKEFCSRNDVDYASLEELWLDLGSEEKASVSRLAELVRKWAMAPEAVAELVENAFNQALTADEQHPELETVEGMTSQEYAKAYKKMAEKVAEAPEQYEEHARQAGMSAGDLEVLFAEINGVVEKYPEVWESQERAQMLHPRNLGILLDVFKK